MGNDRSEDGRTPTVFEDMAQFDKKYGFDGTEMTPTFLAFRFRFLLEEVHETILAAASGDEHSVVDGLIDTVVVALGTLSIAGVDGLRAWDEVFVANMSKRRADNPTRMGAGGADLMKPEGWLPPTHAGNTGDLKRAIGPQFAREFSHPIMVLLDAADVQCKKVQDYGSRADYFIHGLDDLEYEINKKHMRFRSLLANLRGGKKPNFESLRDTLIDQINYQSFAVSWLEGMLDGQRANLDLFGRPKDEEAA